MVWQKLASDTLSVAGDNLINTITSKKFLFSIFHEFEESATSALPRLRFNNDSNLVYTQRESTGGVADATTINIASVDFSLASLDTFGIIHTINITGEEKLTIALLIDSFTAGAGTAPRRRESVSKFIPSPDADITEIRIFNGDTGNFDIGCNLTTLGTSGGEVNYIIQDGAEFHETDTNKIYQYNATTDSWTYITP